MKSILKICIVSIVILLSSCNQQKALDYNSKIIEEQTLIGKKILEFSKYIQDGNFELAEKSRVAAVMQSYKSIEVIKKMKTFDNNEIFKNATLKLFKFYAITAERDYKIILGMHKKGDLITAEDTTLSGKIIRDISRKESLLDWNFKSAQTEFALKYHITPEKNPLQNEINKLKKQSN